jgi:hypothetical protein
VSKLKEEKDTIEEFNDFHNFNMQIDGASVTTVRNEIQ